MTLSPQVLERLEQSPAVQAVIAEQAADVLAQRKADAAEIARLREELAERLPALNKTEAAAQKKFDETVAALETAREGHEKAYWARHTRVSQTDHAVRQIETRLHQTAPAEIDGFVRELAEMEENAQRSPIARSEERGKRSMVTGRQETIVRTSYKSKTHRLATIRAARERAKSLKLVAVDDIGAGLAEIRATIVPGDELEET